MARHGIGKSSGCVTCRKRKIKCDEGKPYCDRCEKSDRLCSYVREHRFVDENARTERHIRKKIEKLNSLPATTTSASIDSKDLNKDISEKKQSPDFEAALGPSIGLQAFETQIYTSFLLLNLFSGMPGPNPWLRLHAQDLKSPSAQASVLALSTLFFGKEHRHHAITMRGYSLYGQALSSLNHALRNPDEGWSLSVVKSAMVLELYEFIASNSTTAWLKHAGGVGRLFELRGPWRHQFQAEREILNANRVVIALEHLVTRKRCFLERPEWKTIPWALEPETKSLAMFLHDIVCDMPGLFEDFTKLRDCELSLDQLVARRDELSGKLLLELGTLYEWRSTWQLNHPNSCWEIPSRNPQQGITNQDLFPTILHYHSLSHANEISLYNATLLLLLRLCISVIDHSFNASLPAQHLPQNISYTPLLSPGMASSPRDVALEICRSVEYHLSGGRKRAGAFFLLFPIRVAWQAFEVGSREGKWLEGIMEVIADSTGFEISRALSREDVVQVG